MAHATSWGTRDEAAIALDALDQPDGTAAIIAALSSARPSEPRYVLSGIHDRAMPQRRSDAAATRQGNSDAAMAIAYLKARLAARK
jgi:hypothetical protein